LVQGVAAADSTVALELEDGPSLPIDHRFPHPDDPHGPATCFETTLDHSAIPTTRRSRLLVDSAPHGDWFELPASQAPGPMVGVEHLDRCPACGHEETREAGRRQHLAMVTCQSCQLMMTSPRPGEDHTLVRYSETYFAEEYLPSQQLTPELTAHIDAILTHAEPGKASSSMLFELGVGGGNLAVRAVENGWTVRGTDVNTASVAHAKSRGLDVWLENADHATSLGGSYGAVISEMSLEHVRRPSHFFSLAADALRPGGRLVVYTVSAEGDSFERAGMASPLVGPAEHLFLFSAGSLVSMCERNGLRVDLVWRNHTADEIGVVATKRRDSGNPAIAHR